MVLVDDDFYMDAEVSISDTSSYIIFKKDGVKYYNRLTQEGVAFLRDLCRKILIIKALIVVQLVFSR